MATTQTVTVLFTDLVGSTELSSALSPGAADTLRQTHFGLLRGAIRVSGGTEVKNLGDGLMVAFTSLTRGLSCAVAMQQADEHHNRRDEATALSVRIGIGVGEATEEDGDYFGEPVIEASRLCAKAQGSQILATEMVKTMAGRHATQEFVSVGDLELKGLPDAVPTVEVVWEPAQAGEEPSAQLPLPARLVGASAESLFAFFGRADELTRLIDTQKASANRTQRARIWSGHPLWQLRRGSRRPLPTLDHGPFTVDRPRRRRAAASVRWLQRVVARSASAGSGPSAFGGPTVCWQRRRPTDS